MDVSKDAMDSKIVLVFGKEPVDLYRTQEMLMLRNDGKFWIQSLTKLQYTVGQKNLLTKDEALDWIRKNQGAFTEEDVARTKKLIAKTTD